MNRRIISYFLFLVFFLAVWFLFEATERAPRYQGKTIDDWRLALDYPETRDAALDALLHLGTNQTPALINKLHAEDSRFKEKFFDFINRQPFFTFRFTSAGEIRQRALSQFYELGPGIRAALPALTNLLHNSDTEIVCDALGGLGEIGGDATLPVIDALSSTNPAVRMCALWSLQHICSTIDTRDPSLYGPVPIEKIVSAMVSQQNDTSQQVRVNAFIGLGQVRGRSDLVMPHLLAGMTNSDPVVRACAVNCLYQQDNSAAAAAVPMLLKLINDTDAQVREAATNELQKIDPIAAAKAGVK